MKDFGSVTCMANRSILKLELCTEVQLISILIKSAGRQGDRWIALKQKLLDGKGRGDSHSVFPLGIQDRVKAKIG